MPYLAPWLIYRPSPLLDANPASWGSPGSRLVSFPTRDGARLTGWWTAPPSPQAGVVLLAHGRSGNISSRASVGRGWRDEGFGVLLFDYRGYGASAGRPSEAGLNEDSLAAYDWLRSQGVASSRIVVVGQSLGDAPAAYVTAHRPCAGLVLVSAFTSLPEAIADKLPWLPLRRVPWTANRFDVAGYLEGARAPVIIAVSDADGLVPLANSRELAARIAARVTWIEAPGLRHNGLLQALVRAGRLEPAMDRLVRPAGSKGP